MKGMKGVQKHFQHCTRVNIRATILDADVSINIKVAQPCVHFSVLNKKGCSGKVQLSTLGVPGGKSLVQRNFLAIKH
jgi:hypothetical protein